MLQALSPAQIEELKGNIKESAGSLTRIAAERDLQKEIRESVKDDFEILPKTYNALVKAFYEQNLKEVAESTEELVDFYESIFGAEG
ncbi:double-stranded DNA-binding protein [Paraglaciecola Antarctic GD virus 1]|nr:double-stranded DNA-binding protein [Paraglaciecola Antarctic GD virus 1]